MDIVLKVNISKIGCSWYFVNYIFEIDGKLVSIENGKPFEFNVYSNKEDNRKRYHSIGRLVDNYVYGLMENDLQLRRITIPVCIYLKSSLNYLINREKKDLNLYLILFAYFL